METINWMELQNGSDIRGISTEGITGESVNLTPVKVERIAIAFIHWLSQNKGLHASKLKIGIGRDSRISAESLKYAFMNGVLSTGATIIDCGLTSTPAMYMGTIFEETIYSGSVMITASHLPYNRNGIKFFTNNGGLDKNDISDILLKAAQINPVVKPAQSHESFDLMSLYADFLVTRIRSEVNHPQHYSTPLNGFHIIVDAGNGAGGFFVHKVLKPLGADTSGSLFLEPDGMFPNHVPNPEDDVAIRFIQQAVKIHKADLGIIFDTDVDRAAAVDGRGISINRNSLIALVAAIVLEEHPGSVVVTDSITSDGLTEFIEKELAGKHHRFKRGYKNVINEAIKLNNQGEPCWLAIETSGHGALKENHFLDDGAYLMTKVLIKAAILRINEGKNLNELISMLRHPVESQEFRLKIQDDDFISYANQIIVKLDNFISFIPGWRKVPDNYEGIRVACDNQSGYGWFLLRMSLHDPVMALMVESNVSGGITNILSRLLPFFSTYSALETSTLIYN